MEKIKLIKWLKKDIRKLTLDEYYIILAYLAGGTFIFVFAFLIGSLFTFNIDNIVKLLVPFGVLLSAGLASVSVMKSIVNTNRIEEEKKKIDKENVKNKLSAYLRLHFSYINMYQKDFKDSIASRELLKNFVNKQTQYLQLLINDKDILSLEKTEIIKIITDIESNIEIIELMIKNPEEEIDTLQVQNLIKESCQRTARHIIELEKTYNIIIISEPLI